MITIVVRILHTQSIMYTENQTLSCKPSWSEILGECVCLDMFYWWSCQALELIPGNNLWNDFWTHVPNILKPLIFLRNSCIYRANCLSSWIASPQPLERAFERTLWMQIKTSCSISVEMRCRKYLNRILFILDSWWLSWNCDPRNMIPWSFEEVNEEVPTKYIPLRKLTNFPTSSYHSMSGQCKCEMEDVSGIRLSKRNK